MILDKNLPALVRTVWQAPRITVRCYGDARAAEIFSYFRSRHPRVPIFRRKTFGAALRPVPLDPYEIDSGSQYAQMRRKVRRAQNLGFEFKQFDPLPQIERIMEINRSSEVRQGEKMSDEYLDVDRVKSEMNTPDDWVGVFDADGILKAYGFIPSFGDTVVFWKILGDSSSLDQGVMYLLVDGVLRLLSQRRRETGSPVWLMYDMYIGSGNGLREFKRRLGFEPHRVKWRWVERSTSS